MLINVVTSVSLLLSVSKLKQEWLEPLVTNSGPSIERMSLGYMTLVERLRAIHANSGQFRCITISSV